MRNALLFVFALGCSAGFLTRSTLAEEAPGDSVYAAPTYAAPTMISDNSTTDDHPQLLPIRGTDLPLLTHDFSERSSSIQQPSVVEAIPTPTAFHAGVLLLLALLVIRIVRKLRFA